MDRLYIRNYFVVVAGMFCWLTASVVSAHHGKGNHAPEPGPDLTVRVEALEGTVGDLQTQLDGQEAPLRVFDANDVRVGGEVLSFSTKTIISPPSQHHTVQVVYESNLGPIVLTVRTDGFDDTGGLRFFYRIASGLHS